MLSYILGMVIVVVATEAAIRGKFISSARTLFDSNKRSLSIIASNHYSDDEKQRLLFLSTKTNLRHLLRLVFNMATLAFSVLFPVWLIDAYLRIEPLLFNLFTSGVGLFLFSSVSIFYGYFRQRFPSK